MTAPTVSVVMGVYNAEQHLVEAVESILAQTYPDFEFIAVDDGSTDDTLTILQSFDDPRMRIIKNAENYGLAKSLNIGIAASRGEYIARMDADDISLPKRFEQQINFMQQNPQVGVCGGFCIEFERRYSKTKRPCADKIFVLPELHDHIAANTFLGRASMLHPTVMFRRAALPSGNLYDESFRRGGEDIELWSRLIFTARFHNLQTPLLRHRQRDRVLIQSEYISAGNRVIKKNVERLLKEVPVSVSDLTHLINTKIREPDRMQRAEKMLNLFYDCLQANFNRQLYDRVAFQDELCDRAFRLLYQHVGRGAPQLWKSFVARVERDFDFKVRRPSLRKSIKFHLRSIYRIA